MIRKRNQQKNRGVFSIGFEEQRGWLRTSWGLKFRGKLRENLENVRNSKKEERFPMKTISERIEKGIQISNASQREREEKILPWKQQLEFSNSESKLSVSKNPNRGRRLIFDAAGSNEQEQNQTSDELKFRMKTIRTERTEATKSTNKINNQYLKFLIWVFLPRISSYKK